MNNSNNNTKNKKSYLVINLISLLFSLLVIASNIVIFVYLKQVKNKCDEACLTKNHYLNRLIRSALIYNFIITITVIILNLIDKDIIKNKIPKYVVAILVLIQLIFTGVLCIGFFLYYRMLKAEDCECLDVEPLKGKHKYLGVWRYFLVTIYTIAVIIPILFLLILKFTNGNKTNKNNTN